MIKKSKKSKTRKKKSGIDLKNYLSQKLRRISYQWPPRKAAIKKARIARGQYKCSSCGGENFGPKEIQADHFLPVIDPHTGFVDWNTYIERLFCDEDGFSIMCKPCHEVKSSRENLIRSMVKNEKKKIDSDDI